MIRNDGINPMTRTSTPTRTGTTPSMAIKGNNIPATRSTLHRYKKQESFRSRQATARNSQLQATTVQIEN